MAEIVVPSLRERVMLIIVLPQVVLKIYKENFKQHLKKNQVALDVGFCAIQALLDLGQS